MKQGADVINDYLEAALKLHEMEMDEHRKQEVVKQLLLLQQMAQLIESMPLTVEVDPANVFRP